MTRKNNPCNRFGCIQVRSKLRKQGNYTKLEVLAKVPQCDYLGVRCSESLRWGAHCSKVAAKANKTLGLIRRTLKPCCREVKERASAT